MLTSILKAARAYHDAWAALFGLRRGLVGLRGDGLRCAVDEFLEMSANEGLDHEGDAALEAYLDAALGGVSGLWSLLYLDEDVESQRHCCLKRVLDERERLLIG